MRDNNPVTYRWIWFFLNLKGEASKPHLRFLLAYLFQNAQSSRLYPSSDIQEFNTYYREDGCEFFNEKTLKVATRLENIATNKTKPYYEFPNFDRSKIHILISSPDEVYELFKYSNKQELILNYRRMQELIVNITKELLQKYPKKTKKAIIELEESLKNLNPIFWVVDEQSCINYVTRREEEFRKIIYLHLKASLKNWEGNAELSEKIDYRRLSTLPVTLSFITVAGQFVLRISAPDSKIDLNTLELKYQVQLTISGLRPTWNQASSRYVGFQNPEL